MWECVNFALFVYFFEGNTSQTPSKPINFSLYRMPRNGSKDITDFNLSQVKIKDMNFSNLPVLNSVILSVCYESVPQEYKFAASVDFNAIKQQVLIPFFEKRMRILRENNYFTVDSMHFKVVSTDNTQCYGRISQ